MGNDRLRKIKIKETLYFAFCILYFPLVVVSCGTSPDIRREVKIPMDVTEIKPIQQPEIKMPDFVSVKEDVSPLKTRMISISARNTPLRDVLYVIAEATGLNVVMERDVVPGTPITITLKDVSAEDALNTVFSAVDYFYSVKDNMLFVKAVDTKIFEIGHPAITQSYSTDVGGDMLSGSSSGASSTTSGASSTTSGASSTTGIKGTVSQGTKSDSTALNFWDTIEKSISNIISAALSGTSTAGATGTQATSGTTTTQTATSAASVQQSVTVNRLTGTIVVTATKKNMERVEQYLESVKKIINRQVVIEARIIEVQLSEGLKYGIDWNFMGSVSQLGTTGFSSIVSDTLPAFQISITGGDFTSLLKALQQQGEVRTLSNPRVNIMNGQTSLLSVGRTVNFISKVETTTTSGTTTGTTSFTVTTSNILSGIIIGIVPYINEQGEISMTITPIVSDLVKMDDTTVGTVKLSLPTVDLRELSTTVKVRDGQMVVIGGLISKRENLQDNQIPILGSIPVVGYLFKSRDKTETRTELVVIIRPVVVSR